MKKLMLSLFFVTSISSAETKIVPLDMEFGYWENKTEILANDMIKNMLANVPEEQRAMIREMMKSKMKTQVTNQCYTADMFDDFEEKFKDSMGGKGDCKFNINESTSTKFTGDLVCNGNKTNIETVVINSKKQVSTVKTSVEGMGMSELKMTAEWKSATCPK